MSAKKPFKKSHNQQYERFITVAAYSGLKRSNCWRLVKRSALNTRRVLDNFDRQLSEILICTPLWGSNCKTTKLVDLVEMAISGLFIYCLQTDILRIFSIGSCKVRGGARNMKYKGPLMAAIFFMTSFNRDRGAMTPLPPPPPGSSADFAKRH